jgi:DnaJ-class molecular chaperone
MSMSKQTHYQILQIVSTADDVTIKRAYCKVALTNHPDKTVHLSPAERANAEEIFKLANDAYEVLNNATKRSAYARDGHLARRPGLHALDPSSQHPSTKTAVPAWRRAFHADCRF